MKADIAMVKLKRTTGQAIIYKTLQGKQNIEPKDPH